MHIIQSTSTRARRAAVAAALCLYPLLAACGGEQAQETPKAGTVGADSAKADTSAMAAARQALGPDVRMAIPFRIPHRNARFIAAAIPVVEWVTDPARSGSNAVSRGHEMVIVEVTPESHAVHKPGLYASREPFLPRLDDTATAAPADSATLAKSMGVEDADGDGTPEAWAAQYRASREGGHTWDVRAYDRNHRAMYQLTATYGTVAGVEGSSRSFSASAEENSAARQWLAAKADELEAARVSTGASR